MRKVKPRKLMCWNKDSITGKAKAMHTGKEIQGINSHGQVGVQSSPGGQDSITHNSYLER